MSEQSTHLSSRAESLLEARRTAGLHRALRVLPPDVFDLASNDYLGLALHPEVIDAACEATRKYGAGARASRLVSGHTFLHEQLETTVARFKKCEAALVFPSGYHANLAVITALTDAGDLICCDKRNHASLIDACLLAQARGAVVRYYDSLTKLQGLLRRSTHANKHIVTDAVYSMDGDLAPLPELLQMSEEFGASLILDDAHGTGTLGVTGRGTYEYFQVSSLQSPASNHVQIGTFSKALGAQGGFVCGSRTLIECLVNIARPFIYTTGLNPAACGAALQSLRIIEREPERIARLQEVKTKLAQGLSALGFDARMQPSPIVPVIVGAAERTLALSEKLLERGVWCPAIRPPTVPQNTSRLRVTAHSEWSDEAIEQVFATFFQCQ
jgi:8-amino-7-oxononanoate synthase